MINTKDIIQSSAPTANIAVNSTPIVSAPRSTSPPTPTSTHSPPEFDYDIRRPLAIGILLWLIAVDFIYKIISSGLAVITLTATFRANHALGHLFEMSPLLCFSTLFFAILTIFILFVIFKTHGYSRSDYYLLFGSSLIIPPIYSLFVYFLLSVTTKTSFFLAIFQESNLLFLLIVIILFFSSRKFATYSTPFSDNSTVIFALLSSIIVFPSFFFTYSLINTSLNPDLKLASIQSIAGHKIYSPSTLPLNLRPDTTFYIDDKKDNNLINPIIKIAYTTSYSTAIAKRPIVMVSQTKVGPQFDLDNYLTSIAPNSSSENIVLEKALDQKAIAKNSNFITHLGFITPDFILITLSTPSPEITLSNLTTIAQSLN
ncbi:MAG: hypothetical protein WAV41_02295 [Microgenomates group bacterium]